MRRRALLLAVALMLSTLTPAADAGPRHVKVVARDAKGDIDPGPDGVVDTVGPDLLKASIGVEGDDILFMLDIAEVVPGHNYELTPSFFEWYFSIGDGTCLEDSGRACRHFAIWGPCLGLPQEVEYRLGLLACDVGSDPRAFVYQDETNNRVTGLARVEQITDGQRIIFPLSRAFLGVSRGDVIRPGRHQAYSNPEGPVFAHFGYWFLFPNGTRGITPRDGIEWEKPYRIP